MSQLCYCQMKAFRLLLCAFALAAAALAQPAADYDWSLDAFYGPQTATPGYPLYLRADTSVAPTPAAITSHGRSSIPRPA